MRSGVLRGGGGGGGGGGRGGCRRCSWRGGAAAARTRWHPCAGKSAARVCWLRRREESDPFCSGGRKVACLHCPPPLAPIELAAALPSGASPPQALREGPSRKPTVLAGPMTASRCACVRVALSPSSARTPPRAPLLGRQPLRCTGAADAPADGAAHAAAACCASCASMPARALRPAGCCCSALVLRSGPHICRLLLRPPRAAGLLGRCHVAML
jgi:hypothetical protein